MYAQDYPTEHIVSLYAHTYDKNKHEDLVTTRKWQSEIQLHVCGNIRSQKLGDLRTTCRANGLTGWAGAGQPQ